MLGTTQTSGQELPDVIRGLVLQRPPYTFRVLKRSGMNDSFKLLPSIFSAACAAKSYITLGL